MKRKSMITLGLLAAAALGSTAALPAFAHGQTGGNQFVGQWGGPGFGMMGGVAGQTMGQGAGHGHAGGIMGGNQGMMPMMMQMPNQMMAGMIGGMAPTSGMMALFDEDGDGSVSANEMRAGLAGQLEEYDEDGDGTLSIAEFETLHNALFRARMVDRFQALDEDGDGRVTGDEMTAPVRWIERMEQWRAIMQPGQPGVGTMMDDDSGSMMDNN
jgi:hypothetical protein